MVHDSFGVILDLPPIFTTSQDMDSIVTGRRMMLCDNATVPYILCPQGSVIKASRKLQKGQTARSLNEVSAGIKFICCASLLRWEE